jgi:hypothetical protein
LDGRWTAYGDVGGAEDRNMMLLISGREIFFVDILVALLLSHATRQQKVAYKG